MCGKATIESVRSAFPPVESDVKVDAETLVGLPDVMRGAQSGFDRTGGVHAAALFDAAGALLVLREDVGRHNAVDKVLGHCLLNGLTPLDRPVLLVSGRSSFEIMQKALPAGCRSWRRCRRRRAWPSSSRGRAGRRWWGFSRGG